MKYIFLFFSLFLTGCLNAWVLPSQKVTLESQIPTEVSYEEEYASTGQGSFVESSYPSRCDWVSLARVVDGDTIIIGRNTRVRMLGIDTPESVIPDVAPEPYGVEAANVLKNLLADENRVCLISDPQGDKEDRYGRRLAYVFMEDGSDVNAIMLKRGAARGYFRFPLSRTDEFKKLEREAKEVRIGLWNLN